MLKPIIYAVCEKVIIAQDTVPSLISLFSKIIISQMEEEIPPNAVAPKEWSVFSMWDSEPGDESKEYVLCTQLFYPDNRPFAEVTKSKINIEPKKRSQMNIQVRGFPIGQVGPYTVGSWVEENQQMVFGPMDFVIELENAQQAKIA